MRKRMNNRRGVRGARGTRGASQTVRGKTARGNHNNNNNNNNNHSNSICSSSQRLQPQSNPAPLREAPVALPRFSRTESVVSSSSHSRIYEDTGAPTVTDEFSLQSQQTSVSRHNSGQNLGCINRIKFKIVLPAFGYKPFDLDDLDFCTVLRQVESRHDVIIEAPSHSGDRIPVLWAPDKFRAQKATQAIYAALQKEGSGAWHPEILIHPPSMGEEFFQARLEKDQQMGSRPVALPSTASQADPARVDPLQAEYGKTFRSKFSQLATEVQSSPSEMQMRVRFGLLRLEEWKRNKDAYSYGDLQALLRRTSLRGTFNLDEFLGAAKYQQDLLTKIQCSPGLFQPATPRTTHLEDVVAKHTLILRSTVLVFETEVISVLGNDRWASEYRLGPIRGYHQTKRHLAVEVVTLCPERKYDWDLSIRTRARIDSLPFTHRDLEDNTRLTANGDRRAFPGVQISKNFAKKYNLEKIEGRTSWVYGMQDHPYHVEAAIFYIWTGPSTHELVTTGSGVTLRGASWDDELAARDFGEGPRQWSDDHREVFPRVCGKDGIDVFFGAVKRVQAVLEEVAAFQYA